VTYGNRINQSGAIVGHLRRGVDSGFAGATKTMQLSVSRSLAELTKGTAVTVNTIMPGSTKTEGVAKFIQDVFPGLDLEEAERRFMRENHTTSLIERLIEPKEIADFVTYVSSPLASAINGAALRIDGGSSGVCFEMGTDAMKGSYR
jgi:NAD(P)-dependent dehydrogenase (short-subunit alcohol dehydrogenase family)